MKKILTIAGSDCSGGAGIQADIKTITVHDMFAMSVITALTAQNTTGVYGIADTDPEFVAKQIDCVFSDIRPDAVKIGMVSNSEIIKIISEKLVQYDAKNIVVDPVMVSESGSKLLGDEAVEALTDIMLPLGTVVTPNIPEAQILCGFKIESKDDMTEAAKSISKNIGVPVLIKGGHFLSDADDLLCLCDEITRFKAKRIENLNTHGTGCTLSAAIACNLAGGMILEDSIKNAKKYITGAISYRLDIGKGKGPLNHMYINCRGERL